MGRIWIVAVAALVSGCAGGTAPQRPGPTPASTTAPGSTTTYRASTTTYRAAEPVGLVAAGGKVWTVEAGSDVVSARTGPGDDPVRVTVGAPPLRAVFDGHLVWVSVFGAGRVVAIDPATARVVRRVRMSGQPEGIVSAFGAIWVVRQRAQALTRVTAHGTGPTYPLGREPRLVTDNDTALFASNFGAGTITRVDPHTGDEQTGPRLCQGAQDMAATAEVVWVACTPGNVVLAVDAHTLHVLGRVAVDGEPDAIEFVGSRLFVVTTAGPAIVEIAPDPAHPTVRDRTTLGEAPPLFDQANVDAVMVEGRWWVSSPSESRVDVYSP